MNHSQKLLAAAHFAATRHRDQRRKDVESTPYINHPIEVALLLAQAGVDDTDSLLAALLHDTVEDTETTFEEIEARFGSHVRSLVEELTDDKARPKAERKQLQVDNAPKKSEEAKRIKLADKTANVRSMTIESPATWPTERKLEYLDWAEQVVSGLRGANAILEQAFDQAVEEARTRLNGSNSG